MTQNSLEVPPKPRFSCQDLAPFHVYTSGAPTIAYSGTIGAAKTRTFLERVDLSCRLWSRNSVLVGRKKLTDVMGSVKDIYDRHVRTDDLIALWNPGAPGGATQHYPNRSKIVWFGADNPGKVLTAEYGAAFIDQSEELDESEGNAVEGRLRLNLPPAVLKPDDVDKLSRALRDMVIKGDTGKWLLPHYRWMGYAFNPDADTHWANRRFGFKAMQRAKKWRKTIRTTEPVKLMSGLVVPAGRLLAEVVLSQPGDNAQNLTEDYQLRIATKHGAWRRRFVLGEWGTFEGQLLDTFDEDVHVVARPEEWDYWGGYPPPTWKRFRSLDFGFAPGHAFVLGWWARKPAADGKSAVDYLYQEIYRTGRIVTEHAKQAKDWDAEEVAALNRGIERWNTEHIDEIAAGERRALRPLRRIEFSGQWRDHDAEDSATLASCGIYMDNAVKERLPGAELVSERLGQGRLLFIRTARRDLDQACVDTGRPTCTWEELGALRWRKPPAASEAPFRDDWVEQNDDGFAMTRYFLLSERQRGSMDAVAI